MGRVLSLLALLVLSSNAYALTCTAPQVVQYRINALSSGRLASGNCSVGQILPNVGAADKCSVTESVIEDANQKDIYQRSATNNPVFGATRLDMWFDQVYTNKTRTPPETTTTYRVALHRTDFTEVCAVPPPPPACQEKQGKSKALTADASTTQRYMVCWDGCQMEVYAAADDLRIRRPNMPATLIGVHGRWTGSGCTSEGPAQPGPEKTLPDGTKGVCTADGYACGSETKKNCGYVNGEYRCITSTQLTDENPCVTTASGAVFCKESAPAPPAPDNGTPGTEATPDAQFSGLTPPGSTSTTTINYYSSTTVNGSSTDPGNDNAGDSDGDGTPDGEEGKLECTGTSADPCHVLVDGDGAGEGDGDGDGSGSKPFQGPADPETVPEFGEALNNFYAAIGASPIAIAMTGIGDAVPTGGAAPAASFEAFGRSYTWSVSAPVENAIRPVLVSVMRAFWSLIAIIVFMKS